MTTLGSIGDVLWHLALPLACLTYGSLAALSRYMRTGLLDVIRADYVRTARAKGLPPRIVDRRHVLRNAMLPVSTIIGIQTGLLLSGAVLTETVFAWPGMGSWLRDAIFASDYPVLQGGILFLALVFVMVNLVVDISYALINPRIRYS
jgi:peptide/nickel transport system permease protein